jgi:hypothetical protein
MKLSTASCASFAVLAALTVTIDGAAAMNQCGASDEAKYCGNHGGYWNSLTAPNAANCGYHQNGSDILCKCAVCYHPTFLDCQHINGTWYAAAANPPPFAYCLKPASAGGGLMTAYPGQGGGGGGGPSGGGTDCSSVGGISNGVGGCCFPSDETCNPPQPPFPKNPALLERKK